MSSILLEKPNLRHINQPKAYQHLFDKLTGVEKNICQVRRDSYDPFAYSYFADRGTVYFRNKIFSSGLTDIESKQRLVEKVLLHDCCQSNTDTIAKDFGLANMHQQSVISDALLQAKQQAIVNLLTQDAILGNWHTDCTNRQIIFDQSTAVVDRVINKSLHPKGFKPYFLWLECPGYCLPVVACVIRYDDMNPSFTAGFAGAYDVSEAIYQSYLKALENYQRAKYHCSTLNFRHSCVMTHDQFAEYSTYHDFGQYEKFRGQKTILAHRIPSYKGLTDKAINSKILQQLKINKVDVNLQILRSSESDLMNKVVVHAYSEQLLNHHTIDKLDDSLEANDSIAMRLQEYGELTTKATLPIELL